MNAPLQSIRPATLQDARSLAELVNMASEGLSLHVWAKLATRGEDPWSIGRDRVQRDGGGFSYRNATVIEIENSVAAGLIGYPLSDEPKPVDEANMPAMFVPLQRLENLAPGTWYVNILAAYPQWRGTGLGASLLKHAEQLAALAGARKGMSIIVADNNVGARRLYERMGYRQIADRPMIKEDWASSGSAWVLLVKKM